MRINSIGNTTIRRIIGSIKRILLLLAIVLAVVLFLVCIVSQQPDPFGPAPASSPIVAVDTVALKSHLKHLSIDYVPRDSNHPENLDRAAGYIRSEFEKSGLRTEDQSFQVSRVTYRNVIARIGPTTKEVLVIGAHYDSCGMRPAADDNASGVAGLLELAKALSKASGQLAIGVELVAYSLEEPPYFGTPHMGSAFHAQSLEHAGKSVRAMISIEMIGNFSDKPFSQNYPAPILYFLYPSTGNFITVVGSLSDRALVKRIKRSMTTAAQLPVYSMAGPKFLGTDLSDQLNYWAHGWTAAMVTDTAYLRNRAYHTPNDTMDRLDYERMGQVVAQLFQAAMDLAAP